MLFQNNNLIPPAGTLSRIGDSQIRLSVQIVAVCNRFDNFVQANVQDQNAIQHALLLLDDEVKANGWDREVYAKLAELTKTYGSDLFTVFAPEYYGERRFQ